MHPPQVLQANFEVPSAKSSISTILLPVGPSTFDSLELWAVSFPISNFFLLDASSNAIFNPLLIPTWTPSSNFFSAKTSYINE
jgi:hypothetical protein